MYHVYKTRIEDTETIDYPAQYWFWGHISTLCLSKKGENNTHQPLVLISKIKSTVTNFCLYPRYRPRENGLDLRSPHERIQLIPVATGTLPQLTLARVLASQFPVDGGAETLNKLGHHLHSGFRHGHSPWKTPEGAASPLVARQQD